MGRRDKQTDSDSNITPTIGHLMRRNRQEKGLTLTMLAKKLGYSLSYLSGAENGSRSASKELIKSYEKELGLRIGEISESLHSFSQHKVGIHHSAITLFPSHWNVPHHRNPLFTGREEVLERLNQTFKEDSFIVSLNGLGGIGKTQIAIEYSYRYHDEYEAVFWVRADSSEVLTLDFLSIANLLSLPEREGLDQNFLITAVQRWLKNHGGWLLIFDNAEDLELVREITPSTHKGHVLLTTRFQPLGTLARRVEIENLDPETGAFFLLRRSNIIAPEDTRANISGKNYDIAQEISILMDGHPLALDQAGAYIEETRCSLSRYLDLYMKRSSDLLKRRGYTAFNHPESVLTTLSLSFEKVQNLNTAAEELLRFCSFLYPDNIPEEIIIKNGSNLGAVLQHVTEDPIAWDELVGALLSYSLLHRDANKNTLTIHRLIQTVIKDGLDKSMQSLWAERVVQSVSTIFSKAEGGWISFRRFLPQAYNCATLIKQWQINSLEAIHLLNKLGYYLVEQRYEKTHQEEGGLYLQMALVISEKIMGHDHVETAAILYNLANLYLLQRKYEEAEKLMMKVLTIREKKLGKMHTDTAVILNQLAHLYFEQNDKERGEEFLQRAFVIGQQLQGRELLTFAEILTTKAQHYYKEAKYADAEELYNQVLNIYESGLDTDQLKIAENNTNLAVLYHAQAILYHDHSQKFFSQAKPLYQKAQDIFEKVLGEHPRTATSLDSLGRLYHAEGLFDKVEPLYIKALKIRENVLGKEDRYTAMSLNSLGWLYYDRKEYEKAELYYKQALGIQEKVLGSKHIDLAVSFEGLATLYQHLEQWDQAESYYQRALNVREKILGSNHPDFIRNTKSLASFYHSQGQHERAVTLLERLGIHD